MEKRKNSYYFTDELINEFSNNNELDAKLVEDLYYFYTEKLRESVKKNNHVAYFIKHFGTLYLTLSGVNYELKRADGRFRNPVKIERLQVKKDVIKSTIGKLIERGNKRIPYFRKVFNYKGVKNNGR